MSRKALGGAFAAAFALTGTLAAQSTSPATQQPPAATHMADAKTVTVEGCLVREKDVPGRQPNVAERAGVMEDFILTHAKVKGDTAGYAGTAGATGTAGAAGHAAGTAGAAKGKMFEIRGIDDTELQKYVGQRVEIVGKLDPQDMPERQREQASPAGEPAGDLPELNGSTIKKSSSTEPCTPAAK